MTIKFKSELYEIAKRAGLKTPPDNSLQCSWEHYPHLSLFYAVQLNIEEPFPGAALTNAQLIGRLSDDECESVSKKDLLKMGFCEGKSSG